MFIEHMLKKEARERRTMLGSGCVARGKLEFGWTIILRIQRVYSRISTRQNE